MTGEEKFQVDLEGYLVIKNVLSEDEVAEMNDIIDNGERQGPPSLWGEPFKRLIDHPKILAVISLNSWGPHVDSTTTMRSSWRQVHILMDCTVRRWRGSGGVPKRITGTNIATVSCATDYP